MSRHSISAILIVIASAFLFTFAACGEKTIEYNSNSGTNGARDTATQLLLNTNHIEDISAPEGDNEDWFYFMPQEKGLVTVSAFIDTPQNLIVTLYVMDGFGKTLYSKTTNHSDNTYTFDKFDVDPDRYFIALKTTEGKSNYTIRADFELPPPPEPEVVEEEDTSANPVRQKCVPIEKCKAGQKCCKPKSPAPVEENTIGEGEKTIKGTIVLVTPQGDDLADVKISGLGSQKNVKPGAKAYLRGLKRKVDIYSCKTTFCMGTVKATSEELKTYDAVDVVVP